MYLYVYKLDVKHHILILLWKSINEYSNTVIHKL